MESDITYGKNIRTSYLNAIGNIRYFGQMAIFPVV